MGQCCEPSNKNDNSPENFISRAFSGQNFPLSELKYNKIVLEVEENTKNEYILNSFYLQYLPPTDNEFYPYILNYFKTLSVRINEFFLILPNKNKNLLSIIKIFLFPFTDKENNISNSIEDFYLLCEKEKLLMKGQLKLFLLRYFEICTLEVNNSFATAMESKTGVQEEVYLEPTQSYFGLSHIDSIVSDLIPKRKFDFITKDEFYQIFVKMYKFKALRDYVFHTYNNSRINK